MTSKTSFLLFIPPAIFILSALLLLWKLLPANPVWITDNGNKYIVTRNIAEYGSANIRHVLPELFPRGGFHFHVSDNGKVRSFHSELLPSLTAPFYRICGDRALHIFPLAGTLALLMIMAHRLKKPLLLSALLFSTPVFFYSLLFWEMTPSIFFAAAGTLFLLDKRMLHAGIALGIGIWFREELYFLAFALFCALLLRKEWKNALHFAISCGVVTAVYWGINYLSSGHILGLHGKLYAVNNRTEEFSLLNEVRGIFFNYYQHLFRFETLSEKWSAFLTFSGAAALLAAGSGKRYNSFIRWKAAALVWYIITEIILAAALWNRSDAPLYTSALTMGLFSSTPIAAGFFLNWRPLIFSRRRSISLASIATALYILLTPVFFTRFDIGLTWGARHFLCIMPMLAILSFYALKVNFKDTRLRVSLWAGVMIPALSMQIWALTALVNVAGSTADFQRQTSVLPEQTILTDLFFIPEQTPELFFEKDIVEITSRQQVETALAHLRSTGQNSFIMMLSTKFRRIDDESVALLMQHSQIIAEPSALKLTPEQEIFIFRCRLR